MNLVFVLNSSLQIYKSQSKNGLSENLELFKTIEIGKNGLSDTFMQTFTELINQTEVLDLECYLFIEDGAGFMNSRIVYLWLANQEYFNQIPYYVTRENFHQDKVDILEKVKRIGCKDLAYSKEPNINKK
jgi:hypothetical protein